MTDAATRQMLETVPAWVRLGVDARLQAESGALAVIYGPYDPAPRSPNKRRHWSAKTADVEPIQLAALWAYRAAGSPVLTCAVDVETLAFRRHEMDDDNLIAGVKPYRDELVRRGLFPSDEPQHWRNVGVFQHVNASYRPPWLVLILRARKGAEPR
jgi:hypothetical protein